MKSLRKILLVTLILFLTPHSHASYMPTVHFKRYFVVDGKFNAICEYSYGGSNRKTEIVIYGFPTRVPLRWPLALIVFGSLAVSLPIVIFCGTRLRIISIMDKKSLKKSQNSDHPE